MSLAVLLAVAPAALACSFRYDPASIPKYYRAEGWVLPGAKDFNPTATPQPYGNPRTDRIPGAEAQLLPHDEYPYIVEFPAQEFRLNGARQRMRPTQAKTNIVRWKVDEHVVAYSYGLIPVTAHRANGKWVVDSEAACIFTATFVDDKGDGVFRILVPGAFTQDLVPLWAKPGKS